MTAAGGDGSGGSGTAGPVGGSTNTLGSSLLPPPAERQRYALTSRAGDLSKAHMLADRERHFLESELRVGAIHGGAQEMVTEGVAACAGVRADGACEAFAAANLEAHGRRQQLCHLLLAAPQPCASFHPLSFPSPAPCSLRQLKYWNARAEVAAGPGGAPACGHEGSTVIRTEVSVRWLAAAGWRVCLGYVACGHKWEVKGYAHWMQNS